MADCRGDGVTADGKRITLKQKVFREMKTYWLNVLYLVIFFSVFTNYRRLVLAHHGISYGEYGISIIKALILAKVMLILEVLRFGRGFEDKPLIVPTVYKSFLFTLCVIFFNFIEAIIRSLLAGKGLIEIPDELIKFFSYDWFSWTMVVFFAFLPLFAFGELNRVLGEGRIFELFFRRKTKINSG